MQEDIDHKSITFTVNTTKMTARLLLKLIKMYLAHLKNPKIPQGKQTIKQLAKQNQGMTNIEITDKNIKSFEKVAKKYGIDFALKKDNTISPPKYLVFFKARDQDALVAAFEEYSASKIRKATKPSILQELKKMKELVKSPVIDKIKNKSQEQSR